MEKQAAKELSRYPGKISGGEAPVIRNAPAKRKLPKYWKVKDNRTPKYFDFSSGRQYGGDMDLDDLYLVGD